MAFTIQITQARQTAVGLVPQQGAYTMVIDYCLQARIGGTMQDIMRGGAAQRVHQPVQPGHPMLTPAQVAALIRQDCQSIWGGQPDTVVIDGAVV